MAEREGSVQQRYCGNCGSELTEGVKFCGNCGTPVSQPATTKATVEADTSAPPPPEQRRRRGIGHTILGIALLMCGIACALILAVIVVIAVVDEPLPNTLFAVVFFGGLAAATLFGAWKNLM